MAIAICSGKFNVTFFLSLGSSIGTSSLPLRKDESRRRVTGSNGPSRVVGMPASVTTISVMTKKVVRRIPDLRSFIGGLGPLFRSRFSCSCQLANVLSMVLRFLEDDLPWLGHGG